MTEIFAHAVSVRPDDDTPVILIVNGNGWEGDPFQLYLNPEEAMSLFVQLGYYVHTEGVE